VPPPWGLYYNLLIYLKTLTFRQLLVCELKCSQFIYYFSLALRPYLGLATLLLRFLAETQVDTHAR